MPVAGRKPKPDGQKRNRVKPTYEWVDVPNVPFDGAPKLPKRPDGKSWPAATKRWWMAVSSMPHCVLWSESDWQFAVDTAYLVAVFHDGKVSLGGEIRQREKVLGTTADARRDLRIRYVGDADPVVEEGNVSSLDDYRASVS